MKILCIDIGRGTQDILLYDSKKNLENCISLIIPSRGMLLEEALQQVIKSGKTPLFWGTNMGGFPVFKHTRQYLERGKKILATHSAAKTFKDDLNFLEKNGFKLVSEQDASQLKNSPEIGALQTRDIDLNKIQIALQELSNDSQIDALAIAVQDHGESPPGISNREFRFTQHRQLLENCQTIHQLSFKKNQIPKVFTRMNAVTETVPDLPLIMMDTGWAAILGTLEDPVVANKRSKLIVNAGNSHTLAAYLDRNNILGLWEHHTSCVTPAKLNFLLEKLANGTIIHEEVFDDGGHGAFIRNNFTNQSKIDIIALTGPNRMRFARKEYYLAAPHGNMMLTGSFGLLNAYKYHYPENKTCSCNFM